MSGDFYRTLCRTEIIFTHLQVAAHLKSPITIEFEMRDLGTRAAAFSANTHFPDAMARRISLFRSREDIKGLFSKQAVLSVSGKLLGGIKRERCESPGAARWVFILAFVLFDAARRRPSRFSTTAAAAAATTSLLARK